MSAILKIELASEQMQINDQHWRTLQTQALYMAHSGESVQATALADKTLILSERRPVSLYFAALTYLEFGDLNTCLELPRETISKDESFRQLVETDPDLKNISALEQL